MNENDDPCTTAHDENDMLTSYDNISMHVGVFCSRNFYFHDSNVGC